MQARADADWYESISRSSRRTARFGTVLLGVFLLAFGAWAGTALMSGAIVTAGHFVATGENKIVQHPDGGVIREIKVREGEKVEAGQVLMVLEDTTPKAELRRLVLREARFEAMRVRLQAEAERKTELVWPATFQKSLDDPEMNSMLEAQMSTFLARKNNIQSEVASQQESVDALMQRVEAGKIQIANVERQAALFNEEIGTKSQLVNSRLSRRSELLTLQRAHAGSSGEIGRLLGEVGDARDRIARAREQINGVYSAAVKTAMEQLHETLHELQDVREHIRSAQAVLGRIQVVAPVNGVVVTMPIIPPAAWSRQAAASSTCCRSTRPAYRGQGPAAGHRPCRARPSSDHPVRLHECAVDAHGHRHGDLYIGRCRARSRRLRCQPRRHQQGCLSRPRASGRGRERQNPGLSGDGRHARRGLRPRAIVPTSST